MKKEVQITPIRYYAIPAYPTKRDVQFDPSILHALPRRWNAKPAVCMALLLTLSTGLSGCLDGQGGTGDATSSTSIFEHRTTTSSKAAKALSIPVFVHGDGRGAFGCVSVAPPVFLSEEEALQVIREEAEASGVHFNGAKSIEGGRFPATSLYPVNEGSSATWQGRLELDGYDSVLDIGFEFVSQADVVAWAQQTDAWASVEVYDMKGTAERLAKVAENTAVFYDPAQDFQAFNYKYYAEHADIETYMNAYTAEQKEQMLEKLREQVRDFLAWLAAEGII